MLAGIWPHRNLGAALPGIAFALGAAFVQAAEDLKAHWGIIQDAVFQVIYKQKKDEWDRFAIEVSPAHVSIA